MIKILTLPTFDPSAALNQEMLCPISGLEYELVSVAFQCVPASLGPILPLLRVAQNGSQGVAMLIVPATVIAQLAIAYVTFAPGVDTRSLVSTFYTYQSVNTGRIRVGSNEKLSVAFMDSTAGAVVSQTVWTIEVH